MKKSWLLKLNVLVTIGFMSTTANAEGMKEVFGRLKETIVAFGELIPIAAAVAGALVLAVGIWAFKQAGKQNSPQSWQVGAIVGIIVGVILISYGTSSEVFQETIFGANVDNEFKALVP